MHDAESENYQRIKNGDKPQQPKDDGTDRRKLKKVKSKEDKKKFNASKRGALNSSNMHYHADEKYIQEYYTTGLTELVIKEKGELSIADALIIDLAAYATVRVYRKSRLESNFGRFMDRTAPQDPVAQILQCIKALNLKSAAKAESTKEIIGKLLASESNDLDDSKEQSMSLEEWRKAQLAGGMPKIQRRAMTEFAEDESKYKVDLTDSDEDYTEIFEKPD